MLSDRERSEDPPMDGTGEASPSRVVRWRRRQVVTPSAEGEAATIGGFTDQVVDEGRLADPRFTR